MDTTELQSAPTEVVPTESHIIWLANQVRERLRSSTRCASNVNIEDVELIRIERALMEVNARLARLDESFQD